MRVATWRGERRFSIGDFLKDPVYSRDYPPRKDC